MERDRIAAIRVEINYLYFFKEEKKCNKKKGVTRQN